MNLKGGERIVSRRETKILIKKAKKQKRLRLMEPIEHLVDTSLKF